MMNPFVNGSPRIFSLLERFFGQHGKNNLATPDWSTPVEWQNLNAGVLPLTAKQRRIQKQLDTTWGVK